MDVRILAIFAKSVVVPLKCTGLAMQWSWLLSKIKTSAGQISFFCSTITSPTCNLSQDVVTKMGTLWLSSVMGMLCG